jgi:23S rRNA pseudouridine1911/1915/1917 synthase
MVRMIDCLYEDNHLLVVNKPAGLPTMGVGEGEDSLLEQCKRYIKAKYAKPGNVYLGIVSRLDALVSGVIVIARTSKSAARLTAQFQSGIARKTYLALVSGKTTPPTEKQLGHWLKKDEQAQKMVVSDTPREGWKLAKLSFRKLAAINQGEWLLEIDLQTGRKHQIRAQLAAIGLSILGDRKYGNSKKFQKGIGLHSQSLTIDHPTQTRKLSFTVSPPKYWKLDEHGLD